MATHAVQGKQYKSNSSAVVNGHMNGHADSRGSMQSSPMSPKGRTPPTSPGNLATELTERLVLENGDDFGRFTADYTGDHLDHQMMPEEFVIGDLHCLIVSDFDFRYTNMKHDKTQTAFRDEATADVHLKIGPKIFGAHRSILGPVSKFFEAQFKRDPKAKEIQLDKNINVKDFGCLLDFVYEGAALLNPTIVDSVYDTADQLQVGWLKDACADYMLRHIRPLNYRNAMAQFRKHKNKVMEENVIRTIAHNLTTYSEEDEFLQTLEFELLYKILSENYFIDGSEGFVMKVILDWLDMDSTRIGHREGLLQLVRYPLMEPEELMSLPPEIMSIPSVVKEVEEAQTYVFTINAQCMQKNNVKFQARGARNSVMLLSANEFSNGNVVMYKDVAKRESPMCVEELQFNGLETQLVFTQQAVLGNFLYVTGGYDEQHKSSNRMFRYDPRFRDWIELASLNHSRVSHAMCSSEKNLFVIGGIDHISGNDNEPETILSSVEMYDPMENSWTELPSLPMGVSEMAATYWNGKLLASGGISSSPTDPLPLDYIFCLDLAKGTRATWEQLTPMLTGRQSHSMTAIDNRLHLLGGRTSTGMGGFEPCLNNEAYDLSKKKWCTLSPLLEDLGKMYRYVTVVDKNIMFIAAEHWFFYDTENDKFEEGDICGADVQRLASLSVAFPPTA